VNIAGVLVHAYPGKTESVKAELQALEGVELHHVTDDGRFIVTVEDAGDTLCDDTIVALEKLPGIASAALTYHYSEPEESNLSARLADVSAGPSKELVS
jgi:nitrate reductase NapD